LVFAAAIVDILDKIIHHIPTLLRGLLGRD
jgi:hypothetical protein